MADLVYPDDPPKSSGFFGIGSGESKIKYPDDVPEESSMLRRAIVDPLVGLVEGAVVGIPETAVGLADIPTMGYAGKAVDTAGKALGIGGFKDIHEKFAQLKTPEYREAQQKVAEAKGFVPTITTALQNPSVIADIVAQSLPSAFAGGRLAMKGLGLLGKGIEEGLPAATNLRRAITAGGVGEGLVTAGQNIEQVRQETADQLLTPKQVGIGVASGALTGLIGVLGGKLAQRLGMEDINTLMAGGKSGVVGDKELGIIRKVLYGAIQEGVFEELPQSMQEQVAQNLSLGKPIDENVVEQGALGMLAGFAQSTGAQVGGTVLAKMRQQDPLSQEIDRQMKESDPNGVIEPVTPPVAPVAPVTEPVEPVVPVEPVTPPTEEPVTPVTPTEEPITPPAEGETPVLPVTPAEPIPPVEEPAEVPPEEVKPPVEEPPVTPEAKKEEEAVPGEVPPEPPASVPGSRNWHILEDIPAAERTDEEMDRLADATGPTEQETKDYNDWIKAREAAAGQVTGKLKTDEIQAGEILERVKRKWATQYPHLSVASVAGHMAGVARNMSGLETPLKASEYIKNLTTRLGVPNKYDFIGNILDKLGVPVYVQEKGNAATNSREVTDAVFSRPGDESTPGVIRFDTRAMSESFDYGPGYGTAHGIEMFVHEGLHAIIRNSPNWKQSEKRLKELLNSIAKYQDTAPYSVKKYIQHIDKYEIDELVTEALSDSKFAQWLDSIPAEGVRSESKTLWGKLKDIIFRTLETYGLSKSKLDELNEILDDVLAGHAGAETQTVTPEEKPATPEPTEKTGEGGGGSKGTEIPTHGTMGPLNAINVVPLSKEFSTRLTTFNLSTPEGKLDKNAVKGWMADIYGVTTAQLTSLEKSGHYDHKAVEEAMEGAIVRYGHEIMNSSMPDSEKFKRVVNMYNTQPNLAARTSDSTIMQQYSTPLPIAYLMNKFLNLRGRFSRGSVFEPTAGNGMLLIGANPYEAHANEMDKGNRTSLLKGVFPVAMKVTNEDALTDKAYPSRKVDRVIANPPFGKTAEQTIDGYKMTKKEHIIVAKSLNSMARDGKAAFIIGGENFDKDNNLALSMTDKIFYNWLYNNYKVTHNIDVSGDLYGRQGTKYPVRLITVTGRKEKPGKGIPAYLHFYRTGTFDTLRDILEGRGENARVEAAGEVTPTEGENIQPEGGKGAEPNIQPPATISGQGQVQGAGELPAGPGVGLQPGERGGGEGPAGEGAGKNAGAGGSMDATGVSGRERGTGEGVVTTDKEQPATGGTAVDQAIKEFGELFAPYESARMPYESAEEEKRYQEVIKPGLEKVAQAVVDEVGLEATNQDILSQIKSKIGEKWEKAKNYVMRWLREEFETFKQMIRDAMTFQVPYKAKSEGPYGNTLVPKNQAYSMAQALDAIENKHGNIDDWVMKELNYPNREALYKAFAAEQIDALAMAIENINDKAGMILGDQTGVGKGRVVAGMIRWANQKGLIPVFVTEKPNLFSDMYRDLTAIDHKIKPFIMNNDAKANIVNQETGEVLISHGADGKGKLVYNGGRLNWERVTEDPKTYFDANNMKVVFTTYSQHQSGEFKNQDAILHRMAPNNILLLDESHNATGAADGSDSNTKLKFLNFLQHADGVLYSSATFAKTPHNMALYYRTALGDTGMRFFELVEAIVKGGNPLQEYISAALAKEGQYLRRELDFSGINYFKTSTMQDTDKSDPSYPELQKAYERDKSVTDKSNGVVRQIMEFSQDFRSRGNSGRLNALLASRGFMIGAGTGLARLSATATNFASVVHNFNSQLLMSTKVDRTINETEKALKEGRKVVINLMNTMGSFLDDMVRLGMAEEGKPIEFTYKSVLSRALRNSLRVTVRNGMGDRTTIMVTPEELQRYMPSTYMEYMKALDMVNNYNIKDIHASPIDFMLSELGRISGKPVMELTNRNYTINYTDKEGNPVTTPILGTREAHARDRQRAIRYFNTGKSDVIIINRAGSVGISLHASQDFADKKPRRMLILQPNLDINIYMQALGRIFRKGQVVNPDYVYVTSDLPSEIRPAVILERKMSSLKANTTAKQKGAESRREIPDMMNKYGNEITRAWLNRNKQVAIQLGIIQSQNQSIPSDSSTDYAKVAGKLTVLPVELQKDFYAEVENDYESYIQELTAKGENDLISKNYDYQAKTIDKSQIHQGLDATNPFSGNVYREVLQVRQLKKPYNMVKIKDLVSKVIGTKSGKEYSDELFEKVKQARAEYWTKWQSKLAEKYENNTERMSRAQQERQAFLNAEQETYRSLLNYMHIGDYYEIPLGEGSQDNIKGILTNIMWTPTTDSNPIQLSRLKFVFSVQDPIQTVIYNASQSWFRDEAYRLQKGIPVNWDSTLPTDRTEEKVVVTGNMLRAFNIMSMIPEVHFEMVNFSRDNGVKEFGLVISRKDEDMIRHWDPRSLGREVDWRAAFDYLSDNTVDVERIITSTNNEITIQSEFVEKRDKKDAASNNVIEYRVSVPASTQLGSKYFQNETLRRFVRNKNFRKMGNRMIANVEAGNLEGFMKALNDNFTMRFTLPQDQVTAPMPYVGEVTEIRNFIPTERQVRQMLDESSYAMNDNYKIALTMMPPGRFLALAAAGGEYLSERVNQYGAFDAGLLDAKEGYDYPTLWIDKDGQVIAHEGRARISLMKDAGIVMMPVRLYASGGGHFSPSNPVPTILKSEDFNGITRSAGQPIPLDRTITVKDILDKVRNIVNPDAAEEVARAPFVAAIQEYSDKFFNNPADTVPDKFIKEDIRPFLQSQNDFKHIDKYASLPWWNAKKYPAWRRAFEIFGINRPERRGTLTHGFAQLAEPFFRLEEIMRKAGKTAKDIADAKDRINRVIITGDAQLGPYLKSLRRQVKGMPEGPLKDRIQARIDQIERDNRYADDQLLKGIKDDRGNLVKLSREEIQVYKSVRGSLDNMFDAYVDHLQSMAFRTWKKQKWYSVLLQAAGMDFNKKQTAQIVGAGLDKAAQLRALKIQPDIKRIFERVEAQIEKTPDADKIAAGEWFGKIADTMVAEITGLQKALSVMTGITDQKKLTSMSREVLAAYMMTRPQLKKIKTLRNLYKKQVAFFPRVREQGDYKITVNEIIYNEEGLPIKERKLFMGMFDSEKEAAKLYADALARYGKNGALPENIRINIEKATKTPEFAFQGVNDINMQKVLDNAIESMHVRETFKNDKGETINVQDYLRELGYQAIAKQFQSRGFGRHMTHRQAGAIKGYKESDLQRVLFNYMTGMAGIMTKQESAADFLEHMKEVSKENNPKMFEALSKYGRDQLRNETSADRFSNKVRAFMFIWYLGGLIRPALIQMTQNFVTGIPEFAKYLRKIGRGGPGSAEKEYTKAMKDVAFKNYTPIEKRFQDQLFAEGVTVDQYIREIYGAIGTRTEQHFDKVLRWMAVPFSKMEMFNRQSAALTMFRPAYELALKEGLTEEEAYDKAFEEARNFVYDTHYAMGKANLPQIAQGEGLGTAIKTLYTFKSFTHNYILEMRNNLSEGDFKTVMHSLAYIALFGGLMALPFMKDLFEFAEKHTGWSFSKSIRQTLRGIGGKTLETFGMNGLPALLGANISGSLAIGVPFMGEDSLATIGGVYEGQLQKMGRAVEAAGRKDYYRVATNMAPEMLRNPLVAAEESQVGKKVFGTPGVASTTRGRVIYDENGKPLTMSAGQAALKTMGFSPTEIARQREKDQTIRRQESYIQELKTDAGEKYRIARLNGDPKALSKMMANVKEINIKIKDRGLTGLVPRATVQKILEASKESQTKKQLKEARYKKTEL